MSRPSREAFIADELGLLPTRNARLRDGTNERVALWADVMESPSRARGSPRAASSSPRSTKMATDVLIQDKTEQTALDEVAKTYKDTVVPDYRPLTPR